MDQSLLSQPRFSQPDNWRWHFFKSSSGHKIRFGSVFPKDKIPEAVVVCLPGFREFGEKYFELAHNMLERNLGFWVIDWSGQGASDRLLDDPYKVHSLGYEQNIADLKQLIFDYVKPSSVHPDVGRLPVILTGHSMGGHIGLRYLHDNPENFIHAAAFSAPLCTIRQLAPYPPLLTKLFLKLMTYFSDSYIPGGDTVAENAREAAPGTGFYSSDPERDSLHKTWFDALPNLKVKGPTYQWLYETVRSCNILMQKSYLKKITTPVLIALAGQDYVVSNSATKKLASCLPSGELMVLPEAQHEILMERDPIRAQFLAGFDNFILKNVLSKQDRLKKF